MYTFGADRRTWLFRNYLEAYSYSLDFLKNWFNLPDSERFHEPIQGEWANSQERLWNKRVRSMSELLFLNDNKKTEKTVLCFLLSLAAISLS